MGYKMTSIHYINNNYQFGGSGTTTTTDPNAPTLAIAIEVGPAPSTGGLAAFFKTEEIQTIETAVERIQMKGNPRAKFFGTGVLNEMGRKLLLDHVERKILEKLDLTPEKIKDIETAVERIQMKGNPRAKFFGTGVLNEIGRKLLLDMRGFAEK